MAGDYLLDTNVAIAILKKRIDPEVASEGRDVFLCPATIGELLFGVEKSERKEQNRAVVAGLVANCVILDCDYETASHFAVVKAALARIGRPIPVNDMWIAATARQHDLIVATRDSHFDYVDGIEIERW